ncbi:MAG: ATP-binding protein [Cellvibrionaceae bacterium]
MRQLLFIIFSLCSLNTLGLEPLVIDSDEVRANIKPYTQFLVDPNNSLTIQNIRQLESNNAEIFSSFDDKSKVISFGFTSSTIWLKTSIQNIQKNQKDFYFDIDYSIIDNISMYHFADNTYVSEYHEGVASSLDNRLFKSRSIVLPIELNPNSSGDVYFKISSRGLLLLPIRLFSQKHFFNQKNATDIIIFCIFGLYIGFFFYHLMVYLDNRELVYLAFSASTIGRLFYDLYFSGTAQLLFPENTAWNLAGPAYCGGLAAAGALWFHAEFLNLRKHSLKSFYFILGYAALILLGINYAVLINPIAFFVVAPLQVFLPVVLCASTIPWLRRNYRPAKIYFYGSLVTLISVLWSNLSLLNLIPGSFNIAILSALGYSASFVIFAFSISAKLEELSKSEQQAQLEAQTAKAKDQTKSDFLANMSHEIRTPLNGVLGMIQLLQKSNLKAEQKNWVNIIDSSGKNLLNIVNDILDYSKIEAGKLTIEKIPCDIRKIVDTCNDVFLLTAKNSRVTLLTQIDPALPSAVETDPARLQQIIVNLVGNAQKFTEQGTITISIKKLDQENVYRIAITDTGIGISKEQQSKLFKSFEQTRSDVHRRYGGTGLGLAICKQLAELLGGSIGFSSEANEGSCFWVDLPLIESAEPAINPDCDDTVQGDMTQLRQANKMNILVAEDNKVNQIVVQNMLKNLGHYCEFVENGSLAVSKIMQQHDQYDLILMDCDMPIMTGYEATEEIRRFEKENNFAAMPIVALTAHAIDSLKEKSFDSGMDDHLAKPLSLEELRATMNKYAKRKANKINVGKTTPFFEKKSAS